jgi:hypothetical protein
MALNAPPPASFPAPEATGGNLIKSAWAALRQDHELVMVPVIGGIVGLAGVLPLVLVGVFVQPDTEAAYGVLGILIAVVGSIIGTFFAVALAAGAHQRMDGGDPSIGSAMAAAWSHKKAVVGWALLSVTVGLVLNFLEDRLKGAGSILKFLGGAAWAVASYFTIPIIATQDIGPIDALKQSVSTMRQRWSNAARVQVRLFLYIIPLIVLLVAGLALAFFLATVSVILGVIVGVIVLAAFLIGCLVLSAVSAYARVALYRYAVGLPTPGFSAPMLQAAVVGKG